MNAGSSEAVRVLHVDDDREFRALTADVLHRLDDRFVVETAGSASDGLAMLAERDFDCVVSDFDMPGRNGIEFLGSVRDEFPDLPFLLFTGKGSEEIASEAISAGVSDYLEKQAGREQYELLANRIANHVERARAQRALAERESHLSQAHRVANLGSWKKDVPADEIAWSDEIYEIFGLDEDATPIDHDRFLTFVHPDDRAVVDEQWSAALDGRGYDVEHRIVTGDGETRWVRELATVEFDDHGDPVTAVGVVQDITDRVERERQLAALNDVAIALDGCESVEAICERTIDASREILEFDLSVVDIEENGFLRKQAISEGLPSANTADMSVEDGIVGKTYRTGESFLVTDVEECDAADPQGPYSSAISVPIGDHGVFQAVAETRDAFTESDRELAEQLVSHTESALSRLEHERRLRRQNEQLAELVGFVGHDLLNPLTVAAGRLEQARDARDSDHLRAVEDAHDRMETLIEEVVTLVRLSDPVANPEPTDVAETVADCWDTVDTRDARRRVDCDRQILADRARFKRLLENLVRNAVEHGGDDVTVTVGELPDGFYVADDGPGIPRDATDRVFESGFSTSTDGSGFGLAIVERIVRAHDWTVDVADSRDGGARFEISGVETV